MDYRKAIIDIIGMMKDERNLEFVYRYAFARLEKEQEEQESARERTKGSRTITAKELESEPVVKGKTFYVSNEHPKAEPTRIPFIKREDTNED